MVSIGDKTYTDLRANSIDTDSMTPGNYQFLAYATIRLRTLSQLIAYTRYLPSQTTVDYVCAILIYI